MANMYWHTLTEQFIKADNAEEAVQKLLDAEKANYLHARDRWKRLQVTGRNKLVDQMVVHTQPPIRARGDDY